MKNNNIIIAAISLLLLITSNSCQEKFLDVKPSSNWKAEDFYANEAEAYMALSGIYGVLAHDDLYGWNFNVLMEGGTDESYTNDGNNTWGASKYEHTSSNDEIKNAWLKFYTCIQLVNLFEVNLEPSMFSTAEYNRLLAKARFYRGFCYFNLANWFGPVPLRLTPSYSQEDNNIAPSPVKKVYEQVETDLLFAAEHLYHSKDASYVPGEPNKMAAHGLLARLYLRMGGYQPYLEADDASCYFENNQQYFEQAKQQCNIVITDGWHDLTPASVDSDSYRNHFMSYLQDYYDLKESLFEISFGNLEDIGIHVSGRLGNINGVEFVGTLDIPRGFCKINAALPLYYKYSAEDKRREWNIAGYRNKYSTSAQGFIMGYIFDMPLHQEYAPGKFRRWEPVDMDALKAAGSIPGAEYVILNNTPGSATDANYTSINFPILRYSDILLMYAEASIGGRFGSQSAASDAVECLNKVRERAGLEPYLGSTAHDDFFNEIVDERLRELCFEGLRKQDLIRWDLLEDKLKETNNIIRTDPSYVSNNQYHQTFLTAGNSFNRSKHLLLPYPLQEVQINQQLDQRTGW
ncbi:Starch-binding associating with outer membrane [Mariniphaga anaerophila]|uniref:Starch-binding associating with outer membrane n=1 Tax=Mariniphaga anaerophila TaxID=1484053 RepID=A0A1M5CPC7_9BACT|nr:RagB/SusD family nutrient uptake outer membrane protein [Mariniphaga anaerophila]SHF56447.1 Starch-binding associating with outer membrane [Mariniphaga anaerophila]